MTSLNGSKPPEAPERVLIARYYRCGECGHEQQIPAVGPCSFACDRCGDPKELDW